MKEIPNITIENVEFVYRPNFEGRAERYNDEGHRYFNAKVPEEMIDPLQRDGWNVKWTKPTKANPNPEEFVPEAFLEVEVGFNFRPAKVILIKDGRQQPLAEHLVGLVDSTVFESIDVVIRPYQWTNDSGSGVKAMLKSMYGIVEMDDLDRKYNTSPPSHTDNSESEI